MSGNSLLFKRSIVFNNLPDDTTKRAVCAFVEQHPNDHKPSLLHIVCGVLSGISVLNISNEWLIKTADIWNKRGVRKIFIEFLIFLCENKYIDDEYIFRLHYFRDCMSALVIDERYCLFILQDENFDILLHSELYRARSRRAFFPVYTSRFNKEDIPDDEYRKFLNRYLYEVKYKRNEVVEYKRQIILSFTEICLTRFKSLHDVSAASAKEVAQSSSEKKDHLRLLVLNELITHLYDDGLLTDPLLTIIARVNKQYNSNLRSPLTLKVLSSEHPEYWSLYTYTSPGGDSRNGFRYINCHVLEIREAIVRFICEYYVRSGDGVNLLCERFEDSLQGYEVSSLRDLGFETFTRQVKYFYTPGKKKKGSAAVIAFYIYLSQTYDDNIFEKDNVPTTLLHRSNIAGEINDGFQVVRYNQIEDVPSADKWLLCYKKYDRDTIIHIKAIDFTLFESVTYRMWIKHYIWKADTLMETKRHPLPILKNAFNYLHRLKTGRELSVFSGKGYEAEINVNDATAYKNYVLSTMDNNRTRSGYIYNIRNVLRHVEANSLGIIDSGVFYVLTNTLDQSYDNTLPIPNDHLGRIAELIKKRSEEDLTAEIYASIFYIALETEFRGSQIVDLSKNCLRETSKKGEYVLVSETKVSAGEIVEQPVTSYIVRELEHVAAVTDEYRANCTNTRLLNKLFIIPGHKKGTYRKVGQEHFNAFLQGCCRELSLPLYTLENLRDTHMTKAEEYRIRNQLSDIEQRVLTGHKSTSVDDIHYVKHDIREMLESIHGVIIGNVRLDGKVLREADETIANNENEVSNGCGYCNSNACGMLSNLDCLLCRDFVTTISRLPYFEEQLKVIDARIAAAVIPHDKEDFVNIKRLMLAYIEEILRLKEEETENAVR